jgi:tetratricopeptide (TPR) repeat protein
MGVKPQKRPKPFEDWSLAPKVLDLVKPIRRIRSFVLLGCVFALKLLVLIQLRDHPLIQPDAGLDTTAYTRLASQVLAGNLGLGPGLYYVSPLYIYFLAGILAVAHSYTLVRIVQIALGTGTVLCVFVMARAWFGETAAWAAAVLAALTGIFTFFELLIQQSSIDGFLTAAALLCLTFALHANAEGLRDKDPRKPQRPPREEPNRTQTVAEGFRPVRGAGVISGIVFGLQTLNRPNVLIAAVVVLFALAATKRLRLAALMLAGIIAGMAPVAIRNLVVAHQFSFVSSHGGLNFYIGNAEGATGYYRPVEGITPNIDGQQKDVVRVASRALGHPATDAEASSYFYGLAWAWIREHPGDAAALFVRKAYYAFQAQFVALPESYAFFVKDERTLLRFLFIGPWLLIPLGLTGLILRRPVSADYLAWAAFVPGYAIAVALFFMAERYRIPLLVALTVGAGGAIQMAADAVRARRTASLTALVAVVLPLAVAANWPLQRNDGRWLEGLRLAQRLLVLGRTPEANALIPRLEAREPRPGATEYGYGAELLDLDRAAEALPFLERAHALDSREPSIDFTLGRALLKVGRSQDALPHLRHGFDAGVPLPQGGIDYPAALRDVGAYSDAIAALRRIPPGDDPDALLRVGRMAIEAKAPDVAEPFFRRAVELRPDAAAHQQLGLDLLVLEKFDEAARELGEASRLDPRDPDTLSRLAYCEVKLERLDAARAHVMQALAINPSDPLARQLSAALR